MEAFTAEGRPITVTYDVRFLGTIWQGLTCASSAKFAEDKLYDYEGENAIRDYLKKTEGDFASIDAIDARRVETRQHYQAQETDSSWSRLVVEERVMQVEQFSDDDEETWYRGTYGYEEVDAP
jgi:hypothetical protein